jgi:hypothetical protein
MLILIKAIRDAKTDADRKAAEAKIRQFQEQWAADHPAKELPAAEQAERDRKMKEQLKNDPDGWQLYQLEQSMRSAKTTDERKSIMAQMADLHKKIQADQEAKMTPQEKAARKPQEEKLAKMRAELAPLIKSMGEATTDAEKIAIRAQMDAVTQKYGVGPRASGPDTPKNPGK